MVRLLNKGKADVLSGRSSLLNSFTDVKLMEDKHPALPIFRGEMKRYCESLHVALEDCLTPDDSRSLDVWRKLQRLKNVCYDSGFPCVDDNSCNTLFANWKPVYFSTSKEYTESSASEVAYWTGGQITEEGLNWLLKNGFKTIVDLRAEIVKDNFYQTTLDDAVFAGKLELIKLPVEVGTAPSKVQVEKFSALVMDSSKKPVYLHSKEGIGRTSAMVSRWKQYMVCSASQIVSNQTAAQSDILSRDTGKSEALKTSKLDVDTYAGIGSTPLPQKLDSTNSCIGEFLNQVSPVIKNNYQIYPVMEVYLNLGP